MRQKWLINPRPNPKAQMRLICFPYAGGNASSFISWADKLPSHIELLAVQPPGRATRFDEPGCSDMEEIVSSFLPSFVSAIDRPYILFGHSLGSKVAFEIMEQCKKLSLNLPSHFIASASCSPDKVSQLNYRDDMKDQEFVELLKSLNGTPLEILDNREIMSVYLPILRKDFMIAESYSYKSNSVFDCPCTVVTGDRDYSIEHKSLSEWSKFFSLPTQIKTIRGDHFFIDNNSNDLLLEIKRIIGHLLAKDKSEAISHSFF